MFGLTHRYRSPAVGRRQGVIPNGRPAYRGGSGPPLMLLHGFACTWRAWQPTIPLLEPTHEVFAPTLPGHSGGPDLPPGCTATVRTITDELERMLDDEGMSRPHIAGNSLGGWLALELARRGRAASVTAFSPGGAWENDAHVARKLVTLRLGRRLARLCRGPIDTLIGIPAMRGLLFRQALEHGAHLEPDHIRELVHAATDCRVFEALLGTIMWEQMTPLPPIKGCRVRVVWSERDRIVPVHEFLGPMRERVPHAEFVIMPDVGHLPMLDAPHLVAASILEVAGS